MSRRYKKTPQIARASNAGLLCDRVEIADTFVSRLVGLLGRKQLPSDAGLWLNPSRGVHTFGMRFPIDVVALDSEMKVVSLHHGLRAWRVAATKSVTHSVLELSAGRIDAAHLVIGETIFLEAADKRCEERAAT